MRGRRLHPPLCVTPHSSFPTRMFDIGFSEILVIAIVALIVIGPERLPKVARTLGHLFGRMQRYVNDVKADIQREMELDELRKLQSTVRDAAHSIENTIHKELNETESQLNKTVADLDAKPESTPEPAPASTPPPVTPQLELGLGETPAKTKAE